MITSHHNDNNEHQTPTRFRDIVTIFNAGILSKIAMLCSSCGYGWVHARNEIRA